jgi:2-oxoglutarate dehydrogenase E1 component
MKEKKTFLEQQQSSFLSGSNVAYIETLFEAYQQNPQSVSPQWREYFDQLPQHNGAQEVSLSATRHQFRELARQPQAMVASSMVSDDVEYFQKQSRVMQLINAYRAHGHHLAQLDPLSVAKRHAIPDLTLEYHGLTQQDLSEQFYSDGLTPSAQASLEDILHALQKTYCYHIGVEYMHISESAETTWIRERLEKNNATANFTQAQKQHILQKLYQAEGLERYLHSRYVGQKRFSVEGGDSVIPMLDELIQRAGGERVKEIVIAMAHRGRLNVLVNLLGKRPATLFSEFEGKFEDEEQQRSGDVKYHMGFSSDIATPGGPVHLALAFNPSHLEIINPVVEGSVRARQERRDDTTHDAVLPILIHGDAAFAGQGVVMETLNISQARSFRTGGTVHIIINNQIGFTTSNPLDSRSTLYCTDVAKMVQGPVFHVNADDPEAVILVTQIALDYRMRFKKDVFIDLVCYRRHGHNEADEPMATQPIMYTKIRQLPTTAKLYADKLINEKVTTQQAVDSMNQAYRAHLDAGDAVVEVLEDAVTEYHVDWSPYLGHDWRTPAKTQVTLSKLQKIGQQLMQIPADFTIQAQVAREMENRKKMLKGELPINWGMGETLAYATLVEEGVPIRLCGQDSGRGTFSHRHAVLHDQRDNNMHIPLQHVNPKQAKFIVIDSILSEEAVLGFEYGYATAAPNTLVIWEAQFGDFANGAQVVIDQFISSGEQKWGRMCGLTLLLPHGYEGMGPEHSSARLERFLQLCAQDNMQVCVPSTPAQTFHMLRRQAIRPYRKPLIVMSPKSLLRHKQAVSDLESLSKGEFQCVIPEAEAIKPNEVQRIVFCSGKVYYDLLAQRTQNKQKHIALIRVEQLYPFPEKEIKAAIAAYPKAKEIVWCQEEPKNQGAWHFMQPYLVDCVTKQHTLSYAGRQESAAPAAGSPHLHQQEQAALLAQALT